MIKLVLAKVIPYFEIRNQNYLTSEDVGRQIELLRVEGLAGPAADNNGNALRERRNNEVEPGQHDNQGTLSTYQGRFWDVPEDFQFPTVLKRNAGWHLWLLGMPAYGGRREAGQNEADQQSIKLFRKFLPLRLPKKVADIFMLHWRPVYKLMEHGIDVIPESPSMEEVNDLYERGTNAIQERVSYIFLNSQYHYNEWTLATWLNYIGRNKVLEHGTDDDKSNLPAEHRNNRMQNPGRKPRVPPAAHHHPRSAVNRQQLVAPFEGHEAINTAASVDV